MIVGLQVGGGMAFSGQKVFLLLGVRLIVSRNNIRNRYHYFFTIFGIIFCVVELSSSWLPLLQIQPPASMAGE